MKNCCTCKVEKPYTEFHKQKSTKDGYKHQCKECVRIYSKQYHIENKDRLNQYVEQYYKDNPEYRNQYYMKNINKIKQKSKQWCIDNAEHYKEYMKQYSKSYSQSEHGKLMIKAKNHKRRETLRSNTPCGKHFTADDLIMKLKLQHGKCVYCQVSIKDYYEIDHFIPATKGGSNEAWNIQLLCQKCNGSGGKWDKLPHEFAQLHGKLV